MPVGSEGSTRSETAHPSCVFPSRILKTTTPHAGHLPLIIVLPFFISSSTASAISFFDLHLEQYPCDIKPDRWHIRIHHGTIQKTSLDCRLQASTGKETPILFHFAPKTPRCFHQHGSHRPAPDHCGLAGPAFGI